MFRLIMDTLTQAPRPLAGRRGAHPGRMEAASGRTSACAASDGAFADDRTARGRRGRPRLEWPETALLAQVVKSHQGRRLVDVTRRVVFGADEAVTRAIARTRGGTQINTAYIESLNATFPRVAQFRSPATRLYFPATGHSLSGAFLAYWRAHHGATLLGAPLSEVVVETNGDGSGPQYPVQWFERGRMEAHQEYVRTRYAVELCQLGVLALRQRGWLP